MKKEFFIGDRRKYGVTLMETVKLEERLPKREFYKVKWTRLTDYKGINTQVFPMVRTECRKTWATASARTNATKEKRAGNKPAR